PADRRSVHTIVDDRGAPRGLHPHRHIEGPRPVDGRYAARAPKRAHPRRERGGRARAAAPRRHRRDRGGLRLAGDGTARARGGAGPRLSARHRPHRGGRGDRGGRDANRGPRLHADRSAGSSAVSRFGFAALAILIAIAALAIAGPFLWTTPPEATDPAHGLAGVSAAYPLGPDELARVVYGETLRWKAAEFVVAAQSLGVPAPRLLARHILPQAIPSLVVSATLGVAFAILTESALSYLGLGVQPPLPSWGNMLQRAQQYVFTAPALAIYPGLAITLVVLAFNFLGDGLRDALDPRRRR